MKEAIKLSLPTLKMNYFRHYAAAISTWLWEVERV